MDNPIKPILLIVDDDESIRSQLKWTLLNDFEIVEADDRPNALKAFAERKPELVLLDLGLPPQPGTPEEGFTLISELRAKDNGVKLIVISGQGEKENAVRAIGEGVYDFFCKPVNVDELKAIVNRALNVGRLEREFESIQQQY